MKNKDIKQNMLINGHYSQLKKIDKQLYKSTGVGIKGTIYNNTIYDNIDLIDILGFKDTKIISSEQIADALGFSNNELKSYLQMDEARKKQCSRLYKHIDYLFNKNYDLIFATFTFNDNALKLSYDTRKQKVRRAINMCPVVVDYIGNIDYGKENEREHYHYIIAIKKGYDFTFKKVKRKNKYQMIITNMPIDYNFGFSTYELIGDTEKDRKKTTKYTAKLGLHALKVKQSQIITKKDSEYHNYLNNLKH